MYTKKERQQYNVSRERICQYLGITKNQYNWLRRKGNDLHTVYEANCNGDYEKEAQLNNPNITAETRYEIDCVRREGVIYSYLIKNKLNTKDNKMYVYFQTDPRGATLYLDRKAIPENNYTQAYCIY